MITLEKIVGGVNLINCNSITERDDWFITDRKPTICPLCGKKEVRPSLFGMPTLEAWESVKWHIAAYIPDFPDHRTWVSCNFDTAF